MIQEAIVLAGGFGTRLQSVVQDLPKPMAPIGDTPFLSFVLKYLKRFGITHVVLSTGHLSEKIEAFYGNEFEGMHISYAVETSPLGTGGAIRFAMEKIRGEEAFVLNGDTIFDVNLLDFQKQHQQSGADASLALRAIEDVARFGSVKIDQNSRIEAFTEKGSQKGKGLINGGVYIVGKAIFKKISIFTEAFSMEKDIFEKHLKNLHFCGFNFNAYFIDIGVPEDYKRANKELVKLYMP